MISGSKFLVRMCKSLVAASLLAITLTSAAPSAQAQRTRQSRRESNANRRARIARTVEQTYAHRWEAAGGGGYLRFRSGQSLQRNNEVSFFGSSMYSLNPKVGIVGQVTGSYGSAKIGNNPYLNNYNGGFYPQISQYTFTAGPSYRFYAKEKYAVTGFVTGGAALGKFDTGSKGFTSSDIGVWQSGTRAAFTAGVNLDYNFYPNLAVRVTPTYIGTTFSGTVQNNKGVNVGLVYRFGKIK